MVNTVSRSVNTLNTGSANDTVFNQATATASTLNLNGQGGDDLFFVTPSTDATINVDGGASATTTPGDKLFHLGKGTINATGPGAGTITGTGVTAVTFTNTESPTIGLNQRYVVKVYQALLLRQPDVAGLAYWSGRLDNGEARFIISLELTHSAEYFQTNVIKPAYLQFLGRPADAGLAVGKISVGAAMRPIQIDQLVNGEQKSMVMPPLRGAAGADAPVPGPDVIVGEIESVVQFGSAGTQVGLAAGTDSCNNGDQPVDWFQLPNTDHPVVPQNLYRMSSGANNNERFEQIGHSWMKHTFFALEDTVCGACNTTNCQTGTHLCPGCSDPYTADLNGDQSQIGSRAWVNPFTGSFPSGADNHSGHAHDGVSHRIRVEVNDLNTNLNPDATYFAEAAYLSPHEYTWCQSHPGQCNMFNNFSYCQFSVSGGPTVFNFSPVSSTVRMQPALKAWEATGATVTQVEPDPGNDGIFFVGYKVTNDGGVFHYDYAIFNMNLDRAI